MINVFGFSYIDEICAVLLLLLFAYKVVKSDTWAFNKMFLATIGIFIFYLIYSFCISSNTKGAILTDFIIQIKPYLGFFCVYALHPKLSDSQKKIIRQVVFLCSIYVILIGIGWHISFDVIKYTFFHPSRLATASTGLAFLYLYCSDYTKNDKFIFILLLSIGILSGRSKHYGFFALCMLMILYFNDSFKMKLNPKNSLFLIISIGLVIAVSYEKIYLYFILGGFGEGREVNDLYARMALYYFSTIIIMDYIPFGSGFGSYATYASAKYYSPIYSKYGIDGMHGLSKDLPDFIADTYYPALAQFGFVGVFLFFWFWTYLSIRAVKAWGKGCQKETFIALMIVLFFLIECTSDSTLTHNRGMFMMMLLGLCFSDIKSKTENFSKDEDIVSQ
jgi:hypothetical protein